MAGAYLPRSGEREVKYPALLPPSLAKRLRLSLLGKKSAVRAGGCDA
jgi:hypothetical protein